jgi:hypothetical protein
MAFIVTVGFLLLTVGSIWFARSLVAGVGAVLMLTVLETWFIELPAVNLGLQIYAQDVMFITLLLAAVARYIGGAGITVVPGAWYLFGAMILFAFLLGVVQYGTIAGVDFRNYFYFWVGAFYAISFTMHSEVMRSMTRAWTAAALFIVCIVAFRWAVDLLNLPFPRPWVAADTTGVRFRVINAAQTYVLGVALLMLFYRQVLGDATRLSWLLLVVMAAAVIGIQHRSVWVMTFTAMFSLAFIPGVDKGRLLGKLSFAAVFGVVLLLPVLLYGVFDAMLAEVVKSAERATNLKGDTSGGRIQGWFALLEHWFGTNMLHKFVGEPFGAGYGGSDRAPHNFYIQSLFRIGLMGLSALLLAYLALMLGLRRVSALRLHAYAPFLLMVVIGQMFFYLPYSPSYQQGLLLGMAIAVARRPIAQPVAEERMEPQHESATSSAFPILSKRPG